MLGSQADGCLLLREACELASRLLAHSNSFLSFLRGKVVLHRWVRVQDVNFNLVDLVVFLQRVPPQVLHLDVDVEQLDAFADVLLHLDDEELVDLHELLQVLSIPAHALGALGLTLNFPLDGLFVFVVLLLNMVEEVLEQLAVIHDELVDDGPVHVDTGELIRVAIDHLRHPCEVRRDGLRVGLDDQVVVAGDVLQEVEIIHVVAHEWCKPYRVLALFPQFQVVVRENA